MATTEQYAYLAGLIDGEGTIRRYRDRYWQVKIEMTDQATITWLLDTFGGTPTQQDRPPPRKRIYGWWLSRQADVLDLLVAARPHLITKAAKADEALESLSGGVTPE